MRHEFRDHRWVNLRKLHDGGGCCLITTKEWANPFREHHLVSVYGPWPHALVPDVEGPMRVHEGLEVVLAAYRSRRSAVLFIHLLHKAREFSLCQRLRHALTVFSLSW